MGIYKHIFCRNSIASNIVFLWWDFFFFSFGAFLGQILGYQAFIKQFKTIHLKETVWF